MTVKEQLSASSQKIVLTPDKELLLELKNQKKKK